MPGIVLKVKLKGDMLVLRSVSVLCPDMFKVYENYILSFIRGSKRPAKALIIRKEVRPLTGVRTMETATCTSSCIFIFPLRVPMD